MRLPNSYGSIVKLSGTRRKPYAVRITVGWDGPKQVRKYLSYHTTKKEAIMALSDYNKNPYDLNDKELTFADVWEMWKKDKDNFEKASKSTKQAWNSGFKHCLPVHDKNLRDIKVAELEDIIKGKERATQAHIKGVCSKIYKFALKHEMVDKDPTRFMELKKSEDVKKLPFTDEEIADLWKRSDKHEFIELILILLYTGMRVSELLEMKQSNVHDGYMIGGLKTEAGKDRIIPIHSRIKPLIEKRLDGGEFLCTKNGTPVTYHNFRRWFKLNIPNHNIHETRHTFISRMHTVGVNEVTIKIIVGHTFTDVTSKVYIHKEINELIEAVEKLD